jgi:hypothetical protein
LEFSPCPPRGFYKCGIFFGNLTSSVELAWLGALPEAITKARAEGADDNDIKEVLGQALSKDNYACGSDCSDDQANSRCYAQVRTQGREITTLYSII